MSTRISLVPLGYDELRSLVLTALRAEPKTQLVSLARAVAAAAVTTGIVQSPHSGVVEGASFELQEDDTDRLIEIIWDLVIERVLTIGTTGVNSGWPHFRVTTYGRAVLASAAPVPHDPSGYLGQLRGAAPRVDSVLVTYVEESLRTYRVGAMLSSAVMLGCASEKAMGLLSEAVLRAVTDPATRRSLEKKLEDRSIKRRSEALSDHFNSIRATLPRDLYEAIDVMVFGIFDMIRRTRNDSGHPTGKPVSRDQMYAMLQVFITYCKTLHALIDHLEAGAMPSGTSSP